MSKTYSGRAVKPKTRPSKRPMLLVALVYMLTAASGAIGQKNSAHSQPVQPGVASRTLSVTSLQALVSDGGGRLMLGSWGRHPDCKIFSPEDDRIEYFVTTETPNRAVEYRTFLGGKPTESGRYYIEQVSGNDKEMWIHLRDRPPNERVDPFAPRYPLNERTLVFTGVNEHFIRLDRRYDPRSSSATPENLIEEGRYVGSGDPAEFHKCKPVPSETQDRKEVLWSTIVKQTDSAFKRNIALGKEKSQNLRTTWLLYRRTDQISGTISYLLKAKIPVKNDTVEATLYCQSDELRIDFKTSRLKIPLREVRYIEKFVTDMRERRNGRISGTVLTQHDRYYDLFSYSIGKVKGGYLASNEEYGYTDDGRWIAADRNSRKSFQDVRQLLTDPTYDLAFQFETEGGPVYVEVSPQLPAMEKLLQSCK